MRIRPLGERVLIRIPDSKEERTRSGLILPKKEEERKEGEVIEAGFDKEGHPLPLKKGDKIIYGGYSKEEFEVNGEKVYIIEFKDILAKIE